MEQSPGCPAKLKERTQIFQSSFDSNFLVPFWFSHLQIREFTTETLWVAFLFPNRMITHYPKRSMCVLHCKHYDVMAGSRLHILNYVAPDLKRGELEELAAARRPGSVSASCLQVRDWSPGSGHSSSSPRFLESANRNPQIFHPQLSPVPLYRVCVCHTHRVVDLQQH